jgi:hypothetical protein
VHKVVVSQYSLAGGLNIVEGTENRELVHILQKLVVTTANYIHLQSFQLGPGRVNFGNHLGRLPGQVEQLVGFAIQPRHERIRVRNVELCLSQALGTVAGHTYRGQVVAVVTPAEEERSPVVHFEAGESIAAICAETGLGRENLDPCGLAHVPNLADPGK